MTMYSSIITRRGVLVGITASGIASPSLKGAPPAKDWHGLTSPPFPFAAILELSLDAQSPARAWGGGRFPCLPSLCSRWLSLSLRFNR